MRTPRTPRTKRNVLEEPEHIPYGYGYFFKPLQDYAHGALKRNAIIVFEYLLGMSETFLKNGHTSFWHSYPTIHKRTRLAITTIQGIVEDLEDEGFLTTEVKNDGQKPITHFTFHYLKTAGRIAYLFGGDDAKHKPEQLQRIKNRKLALRQMHAEQMRLEQERKDILGLN